MSRDPGEGPDEDEPPETQDQDRVDPEDPGATAPADETDTAETDRADSPEQADGPDPEAGESTDRKTDERQEAGSGEPESDIEKSGAAKDGADTTSEGESEPEPDGDAADETDAGETESDSGETAVEEAESESEESETDDEETAAEEAESADDEPETDDEEAAAEEAESESEESETDDEETAVEEAESESEEGETEDEEAAAEEGESDEESTDTDDSETTPIERKTGPAEDEEQPLTVHIEEMVKRVAVVLFFAGVVSLIAFPFGEEFINFLWYSVLPSDISKPHVYHPLELIITQLKAASLLGVVLALPIFVYQTYAFMRPGLYPHERRYYLAAVPTSLVLAFVGLLFGYFLVLPAVMSYFMQYSRDVVDIAFALGETFTLMLILLAFLAVVFQIPLFIMLAIMMGLTTRQWLADRRLIMWGVFLGIAFLFSPDPTGMAPFLIALTMVGLFEGTLALLKWTGRGDR